MLSSTSGIFYLHITDKEVLFELITLTLPVLL